MEMLHDPHSSGTLAMPSLEGEGESFAKILKVTSTTIITTLSNT